MACRALSRRIMVLQPAKTYISGLVNAEKSSTASHDTVRRMAYAARENGPSEDIQVDGTRTENSSTTPTHRPSSGLGRGGYVRRRPTELSSLLGKSAAFATEIDLMLGVQVGIRVCPPIRGQSASKEFVYIMIFFWYMKHIIVHCGKVSSLFFRCLDLTLSLQRNTQQCDLLAFVASEIDIHCGEVLKFSSTSLIWFLEIL